MINSGDDAGVFVGCRRGREARTSDLGGQRGGREAGEGDVDVRLQEDWMWVTVKGRVWAHYGGH